MPAFPFRSDEERSDSWQTPPYALGPLLPYLKKEWLIWECSSGKGNLVKSLKDEGYLVYASDIRNRRDFLKEPKGKLAEEMDFVIAAYNVIITNPPYSLKQQFLERAYALGKPFAFLLPLFTFEGPNRQALFEKHGLELILLDKRITFEPPPGQNPMSIAAAWFTNGLNIGKEITYGKIVR
jgi:hypothetical protein